MGIRRKKESYKEARKKIGTQKGICVQDKEKEKEKIRNLVLSTIPQGSFLNISRALLHSIGINASLFLSDLIWKEKYFQSRGQLDDDGYFFNTEDDRFLSTSLSRKQQRKIIQSLSNAKLISTKKKGIPQKVFFRVNHYAVADLLAEQHNDDVHMFPKGTYVCSQKEHILNTNKIITSPKGEVSACQQQAIDSLFSDRKKEQIKNKKAKYRKAYKLIEYWNNLSNIRKHLDETSKVYIETAKALTMLMDGSLFKRNMIKKTFLAKCSINQDLIKKKWTAKRIRLMMRRLSDYHKAGYWPGVNPNGDSLKERKIPLLRLLYNTDRGTSIFLWVATAAPEHVGNKTKNGNPKIVDKYKKIMDVNSGRQEAFLIRQVNALVKYQKKVFKNVGNLYSHSSFQTWFGTETDPAPFASTHINWLKQKYSGSDHNPPIRCLDVESTSFKNFIADMRNKRNFILEPTDKEKKALESAAGKTVSVAVNRDRREKTKIENEII